MTERRTGQPTSLVTFIDTAIDALDFRSNPNIQADWNFEGGLIERQNPRLGRSIGTLSHAYSEDFRKQFLWGALLANRALLLKAVSIGEEIPKVEERTVEDFERKVLPIARRLSRGIEDEHLNSQPFVVAQEESDLILGRLQDLDPQTSDHIWRIFQGEQPTNTDSLEILRETDPKYFAFAYVYLLINGFVDEPSHSQQGSQ